MLGAVRRVLIRESFSRAQLPSHTVQVYGKVFKPTKVSRHYRNLNDAMVDELSYTFRQYTGDGGVVFLVVSFSTISNYAVSVNAGFTVVYDNSACFTKMNLPGSTWANFARELFTGSRVIDDVEQLITGAKLLEADLTDAKNFMNLVEANVVTGFDLKTITLPERCSLSAGYVVPVVVNDLQFVSNFQKLTAVVNLVTTVDPKSIDVNEVLVTAGQVRAKLLGVLLMEFEDVLKLRLHQLAVEVDAGRCASRDVVKKFSGRSLLIYLEDFDECKLTLNTFKFKLYDGRPVLVDRSLVNGEQPADIFWVRLNVVDDASRNDVLKSLSC